MILYRSNEVHVLALEISALLSSSVNYHVRVDTSLLHYSVALIYIYISTALLVGAVCIVCCFSSFVIHWTLALIIVCTPSPGTPVGDKMWDLTAELGNMSCFTTYAGIWHRWVKSWTCVFKFIDEYFDWFNSHTTILTVDKSVRTSRLKHASRNAELRGSAHQSSLGFITGATGKLNHVQLFVLKVHY